MNIAVLLTNSIRINHDIIKNLEFFLSDLNREKINVDFFCTTWHENDIDFKYIKEMFDFKILDIESQNDYSNSFILKYDEYKNFCDHYVNEDILYKLYSEPNFKRGGGINSLYTVYKINRGFNLIKNYSFKNKIKYDLIFRTRWDLEFLNKITENHLIEAKNKNGFFGRNMTVQIDPNLNFFYYTNNWICDDYFYANFETFEKITNLYNHYYEYSKKYNTWITHIWFREYLNDNSILFNKSSIIGRLRRPEGVFTMTAFYY